jgi:hypothetical protein
MQLKRSEKGESWEISKPLMALRYKSYLQGEKAPTEPRVAFLATGGTGELISATAGK